ncbi:unnamed protein product [Discosporangium mesarthrocarpum]
MSWLGDRSHVGHDHGRSHGQAHVHGHGGGKCCSHHVHPPTQHGQSTPNVIVQQQLGTGLEGPMTASVQGGFATGFSPFVSDKMMAEKQSLLNPSQEVVTTIPGVDSTDTGTMDALPLQAQVLVSVRYRNVGALKRLCSSGNKDIAELVGGKDNQGHSLMHWAAKGGDVEIMETLADAGCPTGETSTDGVGMTPLHWAATEGHLMASAWLLGPGGVPADSRDKQGCTPLIIAAQYGFVELVVFLSTHGGDSRAVDISADSALHWAAYKGHVQVLVMLLKMGLDVEERDAFGQTPLHLASLRGNLEAVEYLVLEANANVEVVDKSGKSPLDLAIKKGGLSVEIFLRSVGAGLGLVRGRAGAGAGGTRGVLGYWLRSPALCLTLLRRPRLWKGFVETGEGVQGARWPLFLNICSMAYAGWLLLARFFSEAFLEVSGEQTTILTAAAAAQVLMWIFFLATWLSDPG